jgi:predicted CoA-substrate-specific enzyme activase
LKTAGIDIGSRFIKLALVEEGQLRMFKKADTSVSPIERCHELLRDVETEKIMATGYGRHLFEVHIGSGTITEIKAFARGARALFPECRTIIDIGGQDTKVISLDEKGNVRKFEMNDRCAAGTGKFLEIMAKTLDYPMKEFDPITAERNKKLRINSMCTVFAESEVVSLIAKGEDREDIAVSVHQLVADRVLSMLKRIPIEEDIVFAGGCAKNRCLRGLIEHVLGKHVHVAENPEITGALGAALLAMEN